MSLEQKLGAAFADAALRRVADRGSLAALVARALDERGTDYQPFMAVRGMTRRVEERWKALRAAVPPTDEEEEDDDDEDDDEEEEREINAKKYE